MSVLENECQFCFFSFAVATFSAVTFVTKLHVKQLRSCLQLLGVYRRLNWARDFANVLTLRSGF